jgi:sn-glycerol 3-phosphate transport system ATP-binding protein
MAELLLDRVGKIYSGGVRAVRDISFAVPDGGFCVLVGPSGCGKSTLLRMIAGLETVSEGTISLAGRAINTIEPGARDIAMVFQNYALYPHMNVYDNMAYGLRNRKTPETEIAARVAEAARILEIEPFLKRKPRQLSGGQRQRVAMGRAIVRKPQAFLFDEPLSNLDAKLRGHMRVEIKRLQRQLATTAVYVTHDQLEAMTLADVLVVMNAGRIEQIGAPLYVYENPASVFVAQFIGAPPMNLIEVSPETGVPTGVTGLPGLPIPRTGAYVGIRPEHLERGEPSNGGLGLTLTIDAIEAVGVETFFHGRLDGSNAAIVIRESGRAMLPMGVPVSYCVARQNVHLFDKASGQRVEF